MAPGAPASEASSPPSSTPDFRLRPARWQDLEQLVDLYLRGSGDGRQYYHPFRFDPVLVRLVFGYFILARPLVPALLRILPAQTAVMLVAVHGPAEAVLGFGTVRFARRSRRLPAGKYGFLVDQRYRGHGIGTRLGEAMLLTSRALGLTEGEATILRDNEASIRVARRFGFRVDPSTFEDRGAPGRPTVEISGDLREVGHGSAPPLVRPREPPAP